MNEFLPKGFVETERRRTFQPDESFARRVVLRIRPVVRSAAPVWDYVPSFARRMVVATMVLLLIIVGIQMIFPGPPQVGIVEEYLEAGAAPGGDWLYRGAELPEGDALLVEISLVGELR